VGLDRTDPKAVARATEIGEAAIVYELVTAASQHGRAEGRN
jgi:hypothetical protein